MRFVFRLYKNGALWRTEKHTVPEERFEQIIRDLATRHATEVCTSAHAEFMIEVECLDEPDPMERFLRFGSDPSGMLFPLRIDLTKDL